MRLSGQLDRHVLESALLRDNPLGDPCDRDIYIYRPPNYHPGKRYPVVVVLAGYGSTNHSLVAYDAFAPNLVERYDALVRTGQSQEALLVLPDCMNRYGGSQFLDSTATGKYQSYLADEVVPYVDRQYRTLAERSGRAIIGRSSGGFGALRMGIDRPEVFGTIGSHAGDSAFELSIRPALLEAAIAFDHAGSPEAFVSAFFAEPGRHSFSAMMLLAYAAAYAPQADAPMGFQLPFDIRTAELLPEVWKRFMAHDPVELLQASQDALRGADYVFLDAGDRDEHGLQFGTRSMAALLEKRGCPLLHEEFPGTHRGTGYRYDRSLPLLIDACTNHCA